MKMTGGMVVIFLLPYMWPLQFRGNAVPLISDKEYLFDAPGCDELEREEKSDLEDQMGLEGFE